jgi:hypothetical protein
LLLEVIKPLEFNSLLFDHREVCSPIVDALEVLIDVLLNVELAESSPFDVLYLELFQLRKQFFSLNIDRLQELRVLACHVFELARARLVTASWTNNLSFARVVDEPLDLSVILGLQVVKAWIEFNHSVFYH